VELLKVGEKCLFLIDHIACSPCFTFIALV